MGGSFVMAVRRSGSQAVGRSEWRTDLLVRDDGHRSLQADDGTVLINLTA
jgi:hypothetical protein